MAEMFNVCQVFADGTHEDVIRGVPPNEAAKTAASLTQSKSAVSGTTRRVVITDYRNETRWEWTYENDQRTSEVGRR